MRITFAPTRMKFRSFVKAFLIKVTGFFRDPEAFEFLQGYDRSRIDRTGQRRTVEHCGSGLLDAPPAKKPTRWRCSLRINLGEEFPEWNVKIFATDLAADAISFARRGLYPENCSQRLDR